MSDRVSVSIGIPFLNARPYLGDAVRSVFAQTHHDWELILIDDGSSDGSLDVVRHLDDPRVRVLSDRTHRGLSARLNQIASLAESTYLARMDADDLMHPERIERQIEFLRANPNVDVVATATFTVDGDLTLRGIRGERPLDSRAEVVLLNGLVIHPTVTGRTEWFRSNPYDPAYSRAQDRELWSRTCTTATFARLCEPLFFYREGATGNLQNYLRAQRDVRSLLYRYGPSLLGPRRTRFLVLRSELKSMAYRLGSTLGLQSRLIAKRNRPLSATEMREARRILSLVLATGVPGLQADAAARPVAGPLPDEGAA